MTLPTSPPAPNPLAGVDGKIARAEERLVEVNACCIAFDEAHQNLIVVDEHPEMRCRAYRVAYTPEIPRPLMLALGDLVHNLRSALDQMAYALILNGPLGGTIPSSEELLRISYPMPKRPSGGKVAFESHGSHHLIRTFAKPGAENAVLASEAYLGGVGTALHRISILDNIDKHRMLIAATTINPLVDLTRIFDALRSVAKTPDQEQFVAEFMAEHMPGGRLIAPRYPVRPLKAGDILHIESLDIEADPNYQLPVLVAIDEVDLGVIVPVVELAQKSLDAVRGVTKVLREFVV